ncbi:MAG: hypothetical protein JWO94_758 [Verrucomicrobiaceae bacterium]|nr:hypothetical protein [Verrucomicrobiaceae bacterium]
MKLPLFLALVAVQSLHADWVIIQNTTTGDAAKPMTIKIKEDQIRNDMGDKMTVILHGKDGSVEMYMHDQKKLIRMDAASLKGVTAMAGKFLGGEDGAPAKPKPTGEMVKVGAWNAEIYTWESKIGSAKFYIAKDFPRYAELNKAMDKISKSMSNPMASLYPSASDFPGMVVKTEMTVMGKPTTTELVSATEAPLSDNEFKAPEGYTEMKLPSFPNGVTPGAK